MSRALQTISIAGGIAGALDIGDAFVMAGLRGITPWRVLQSVAAGLLGKSSYAGGGGTVLLGLVFHFTIALTAAALFYGASRRVHFLTRRPVVSGLLYGGCVYTFMNFVVLPLSAIGYRTPGSASVLLNGVLAILLLVGLPIALIVQHEESESSGAGLGIREHARSSAAASRG